MGYGARVRTAQAAQEPQTQADIHVTYFCGKCGTTLGEGQTQHAQMHGVCPGCASIITIENGKPFALRADLTNVPLKHRGMLEANAEKVRKQLGLAPSLILPS